MTQTSKPAREPIPGEDDDIAAIMVPTSELREWIDNPRKSDKTVGVVVELIRTYGFGAPLVARKDGELIAGHTRLRAAIRLGLARLPVRFMPWLTDDQAHDLAIADNAAALRSSFDENKLGPMLAARDQARRELLGFTKRDITKLLARTKTRELNGDTDRIHPPVPNPVTRPGDLWRLGSHRLACGDSTKRAVIVAAMRGERAELLATDPPYGVAYGKRGGNSDPKNAIRGDLSQSAIPLSFAVALEEALDANARLYLFGGSGNFAMYLRLFDHHLHQEVRSIVWVKDGFVMRHHAYHSQFELIYWGWRGRGGAIWFGDRKQSDVWEIARVKDTDHPTEKPVEAYKRMIGNSCEPGGLVLEPFAGSGSCLVAAEALGRRCTAVELDPRWCDAIVDRWQTLTGEKAVREPGAVPVFDDAPEPSTAEEPCPPTSPSARRESR